VTDIQKY